MPVPEAQPHKRQRRRYEEIERMYKCGHNGCEKAYGKLYHLNGHVLAQSHGEKRTSEGEFACSLLLLSFPKLRYSVVGMIYYADILHLEFKSIREEWNNNKKLQKDLLNVQVSKEGISDFSNPSTII